MMGLFKKNNKENKQKNVEKLDLNQLKSITGGLDGVVTTDPSTTTMLDPAIDYRKEEGGRHTPFHNK